jgi:hypothetical protein
MDYLTKWPKGHIIPNQDALMVANVLVTNIFHFRILSELQSDQVMAVAENVMVPSLYKMGTTPLHSQSGGMIEHYIKTAEKHLRKVTVVNQWDCYKRLPLFLLAFRAFTCKTTGTMLASMSFGKELCLPCKLLFGVPPDKKQPMTDYMAELMERLHDIHHYASQLATRISECQPVIHNAVSLSLLTSSTPRFSKHNSEVLAFLEQLVQ